MHAGHVGARGDQFTGVPRPEETSPPKDPTVALCLGIYGESREVGDSYERGTPVDVCLVSVRKKRSGCTACVPFRRERVSWPLPDRDELKEVRLILSQIERLQPSETGTIGHVLILMGSRFRKSWSVREIVRALWQQALGSGRDG